VDKQVLLEILCLNASVLECRKVAGLIVVQNYLTCNQNRLARCYDFRVHDLNFRTVKIVGAGNR